jgi:hypothetical protein
LRTRRRSSLSRRAGSSPWTTDGGRGTAGLRARRRLPDIPADHQTAHRPDPASRVVRASFRRDDTRHGRWEGLRCFVVRVPYCKPSPAYPGRSGRISLRPGLDTPCETPLAKAAVGTASLAAPDSLKQTQWVKGAIIGGAIGVVGFATLGFAMCGLDDHPGDCRLGVVPLSVLLGGFSGGMIGALIGGAFPKSPPSSLRLSMTVRHDSCRRAREQMVRNPRRRATHSGSRQVDR